MASATVTFDSYPPTYDGGSPITGFTVSYYESGNATVASGNVTANSSPVSVTGLTSGVSYVFTVHATNAIGDSVESALSNVVSVP